MTTAVEGGVSVLFGPCPDDPITSLVVYSLEEGEAGDRPVLWEIAAPDPQVPQPISFVIGDVPEGFEEVVAYEEPLEAGERGLVAVASAKRSSVAVEFAVSDLRPGLVEVAGVEPRDRDEFNDAARGACPPA